MKFKWMPRSSYGNIISYLPILNKRINLIVHHFKSLVQTIVEITELTLGFLQLLSDLLELLQNFGGSSTHHLINDLDFETNVEGSILVQQVLGVAPVVTKATNHHGAAGMDDVIETRHQRLPENVQINLHLDAWVYILPRNPYLS